MWQGSGFRVQGSGFRGQAWWLGGLNILPAAGIDEASEVANILCCNDWQFEFILCFFCLRSQNHIAVNSGVRSGWVARLVGLRPTDEQPVEECLSRMVSNRLCQLRD